VNVNGETALMLTATQQRDAAAALLANKAGATCAIRMARRHFHCRRGFHSDIVEALVAHGAEVDARDEDGKTL
jgi:ankyrin repeat protein